MMSEHRFRATGPLNRARTAVGAPVLIGGASLLLSSLGRHGRRSALHGAEKAWGRATARFLRLDVDAIGLDLVDPAERYVVMPLHEGFADIVVLLSLPLDLRFTVRDELFEWRLLGRYLAATDQIVLPSGSSIAALRGLYRGAAETFDRGESLVLFPQGSILGVEVAFYEGAFRVAEHFGRPILPVVITGTHRVWEYPYTPTLRYGQRVSLRVLPPVTAADAVENAREIERRMKAVAVAPGMAPVRRFVPERDGWWDDYPFEIDPDYPQLAAEVARRRRQHGSA